MLGPNRHKIQCGLEGRAAGQGVKLDKALLVVGLGRMCDQCHEDRSLCSTRN